MKTNHEEMKGAKNLKKVFVPFISSWFVFERLFTFNYLHDLVGFYFGQFFNPAAGPSNRDLVNHGRRTEAEMQPPIGM